jgi:hypothetical protein
MLDVTRHRLVNKHNNNDDDDDIIINNNNNNNNNKALCRQMQVSWGYL